MPRGEYRSTATLVGHTEEKKLMKPAKEIGRKQRVWAATETRDGRVSGPRVCPCVKDR